MAKPVIAEGCIQCGACVTLCPDVFRMGATSSEVIPGVDYNQYKDKIDEAIETCPQKIISWE